MIKEELGDVNDKDDEVEKLKLKAKKLKCPSKIKERLNHEIQRYEYGNINSPESGMIRTYIDWLLKLPWNNYTKDEKDLKK